MLTLGLIDANEKVNKQYAGLASSVVGAWLKWEVAQAGLELTKPSSADVVLLAYAGALDWLSECKAYLRKAGIETDAQRRRHKPYVIAGGPCDAIPFTVLSVADALTVGEAYNFVRLVLGKLKSGCTLNDLRAWINEYPHVIEREQIAGLQRDAQRPWLLTDAAPKLATPDTWVDWGTPPVRGDDGIVRVVAEKGCHCKCLFCATTYRQTHRQNLDEDKVFGTLKSLKARGEKVHLVSNDPMALPYFRRLPVQLDTQSFTVMEISDDANRRALIRRGIRNARFGVEGISERIRKAFAKPISNDHLLSILTELHANKINTYLFFIVGVPYETETDWDEFRVFYERLSRTIKNGVCRIKFSTFVNTPPAPLARYVPGNAYASRMDDLRQWISGNAASRHLVYVRGRGIDTHIVNVAEQLAMPVQQAKTMLHTEITVDLLPTASDAQRAIWEIIDWPISANKRWRMADTYRRRMTGQEPVLLEPGNRDLAGND